MSEIRTYRFTDAQALVTGLSSLRKIGVTPRGLLFLALEPSGAAHVAVPEDLDDVTRMKVGEKLALAWPIEGRFYHFDSVHRLRAGQYLFNGDRRLQHPGDADDCAGAVVSFLKGAGAQNVFFGCTPHQPGTWLISRRVTAALHDVGFVEAVPVQGGLLARRIMDHRLWQLDTSERLDGWESVFDSPLGNVLMLERRIIGDRLVLTCEGGLVEVDVSNLPSVREMARVPLSLGIGVVGRVEGTAFAVTQGRREPWGLDDLKPALLIGAAGGSLAALGDALATWVSPG